MKFIKSIRMKYLLSLLAVSVLSVLFFSFYMLKSNRDFYNSQIEAAGKSEVRRITTRINENYEDVQKLLGSLLFSTYDGENCMTAISEMERSGTVITDSQRLKNYRMFKYICTNLLENASHVEGVYLFCENEHVYSFMKNQDYGIEKFYQEESWYRKLLDSGSSLEVAELVNLRKRVYGHGSTCFLAAQKFQSVKKGRQAVLAVVCSDSIFDDVRGGNNLPWGRNSLIVDGKGEIMYGNTQAEILTTEQRAAIAEGESGIIHTENVEQTFVYGSLDINDWTVITTISLKPFYDLYLKNMTVLYIIIGIDIFVIALIVLYMDRRNIRPIVRLANVMEVTTRQGFLFHNEYKGREDEIGILYAYYEQMMEQINSLIKEKYENEIKTLKSRLRNLTSQINAHFIFNTLENISCLAQIEGNRQIETMSKSLGDMLRYGMDFEGDLIRLEKEVTHIQQYLNIQEVRFDNRIIFQQDFAPEAAQRKVMKFMLQPIVENAIEHGLIGTELPWIIRISAERQDEDLVIRVWDNGVGIDEEKLELVRRRIYMPDEVDEEMRCINIGLANIHQRLQLLFADSYGLKVNSSPGEGTAVILRIPWI